jgi:hypothetical protein
MLNKGFISVAAESGRHAYLFFSSVFDIIRGGKPDRTLLKFHIVYRLNAILLQRSFGYGGQS